MAFQPAPHDPSSLLRSFHKVVHHRRQAACALYSAPLASDDWPVYEDVTITWDPSCVTVTTDSIDLYLNVQEDSGLVAVHEWTDVVYADGELVTQFKPSWWNASTGAGSVSAQVSPPRAVLQQDRRADLQQQTADACSWPSSPLVRRAGIRPLLLDPCSQSPTTERELVPALLQNRKKLILSLSQLPCLGNRFSSIAELHGPFGRVCRWQVRELVVVPYGRQARSRRCRAPPGTRPRPRRLPRLAQAPQETREEALECCTLILLH